MVITYVQAAIGIVIHDALEKSLVVRVVELLIVAVTDRVPVILCVLNRNTLMKVLP